MNEELLKILLKDRTTGKNILWANGEHDKHEQIQPEQTHLIEPRCQKNREQQKQRTRDRAEIFTPPDICAMQNDLLWKKRESWTEYVDAKFLEIACGEAPYLVSRYNAVTGDDIQLDKRIGLLDRKLRLVSKHTDNVNDWLRWAGIALCSVYGYEFQGDNLFLARQNVFDTFVEYFADKFLHNSDKPPENFWSKVADVISWNLWQMDGITKAIPYYEPPPEKPKSRRKENPNQETFEGFGEVEPPNVYCRIMDWKTGKKIKFKSLTEGAK